MRGIVLALAGLLLAGCYESRDMLLNPGAAVQPVKTAMDWKYQSDGDTYHAKLSPRSDGWYDYEEAEVASDGSDGSADHHVVLLNFLERANNADIYIFGMRNEREMAYMYGLAVVRPGSYWTLLVPNCDVFTARGGWSEMDREAAIRALPHTRHGQPGCLFPNDTALRRAMRTLVASDGFWKRLDGAENPNNRGWLGVTL